MSEKTAENIKPFESVEREESHRESLHHLAEEVAEDLGHPTTRKGWLSYWKERLEKELLKELSFPERHKLSNIKRNEWIQGKAGEYIEEGRFTERRTQIMHRLASRLAEIDGRIDYPESEHRERHVVSYNPATNELYVATEDGTPCLFRLENILTDIDWGIQYRPAPDVPEELWRRIRKRSDIAEARKDLEALFNEKLAVKNGLSLPTTSISGSWLEEHFTLNNSPIAGIISERMAKNTLYLLGRQHAELGLKIENSNAFEDAELKYDFKIAFPDIVRGVATEPEGLPRGEHVATKRKLGVQFTMSERPDLLQKKAEQLKAARGRLSGADAHKYVKSSVDDIVLVSLNLKASERYKKWLSADKPPGGPEQYVTEAERRTLLDLVTAGLQINAQET